MEEFKNLKEIIEKNEETLKKSDVYATVDLKELQNLINKYKEQEKIIELMAFELATEDENYLYRSIDDIIECFKKKAKGD